jgi:pentatricopeptide repeat protein
MAKGGTESPSLPIYTFPLPKQTLRNLVVSQMGLTQLLNFLQKASKNKRPTNRLPNISCKPTTQTVPLRSFASTIKNPFETNDKNVDVMVSDGVLEAAESICKIVSKSSGSSVEASLARTSIEVSPVLVVEVLKKLGNAGALALSFFKWAEKQKGFEYSTESYNALIEALGKIKQFKLIWDLVSDMKRKGQLSKETFALIVRRYARARMVKEAIEAFEKVEKFGMKLEV